ncbi:hypothetical protein NIE88_19200 [Sporolactobacillus shoreicorticis]|uniref:KTSC domain-containing protein n=1 Tax=Sporolactobacillus shoreicorticis TaxID=1923877 RepID=A0ABW5S2U7_9BACL|nr:hypothetical protein [Sporolactobacillus shoreicorticis]MCO7127876.1 hypothetical protein [Sporolactobacillus shoreicorticis]
MRHDLLEEHKALFDDTIDRNNSYLVSYSRDGIFTVLGGNPPENFYLSFEDYKKKVCAKYGVSESDFMVPVEE